MRILLVTGRLAYAVVKRLAVESADVLMLDVGVAAFVTPGLLEKALIDKRDYDLVLVTGLSTADFSGLEKKLGMKIRLGPKHAFDIPLALKLADTLEFSHKVPACQLLTGIKRESALKEIQSLEEEASPGFMLKGIKVGRESMMKVCAEVVDAPSLSDIELIRKIESYSSADIIDLGIPLETTPEAVSRVVRVARSSTSKPVSVDTIIPGYIEAGVEEGADMVLSLNGSNLDRVGPLIAKKGIAAVVIPDDESLESLVINIERAKKLGIKKILADPVLSPIGHGMVASIERYSRFRKIMPDMPVFFGAGNVTELMDADSIGVNATLAGMAMEVGASVLFTTEHSQKALGSADELKRACMMMALAKHKDASPKDLGVDLLVIKEKRPRKDVIGPSRIVEGKEHVITLDPKGGFNVWVDNGKIYAKNGDITVEGTEAIPMLHSIVDMGLVSQMDHAGYLGAELRKAEIALMFNRTYIQDDRF